MSVETCDRCPARAMVAYFLAAGGCLVFCAHHSEQYWPFLWSQVDHYVELLP